MIPAAFEYTRPSSLADAIGAVGGGAKVIAGGQSLLPLLKLRLASAEKLVDIGRLEELKGYRPLPDGGLEFGALTTYAVWQAATT
ncbi:MAG: FAD binding domain-containing protein, partial [Chloroflexota bacterium]